jgi:hypothetical protein
MFAVKLSFPYSSSRGSAVQAPLRSTPTTSGWVYASLTVVDGERTLKPTHVASHRLIFASPPRLVSPEVEIILRYGDDEQRAAAAVLPHHAEDTRIPIRLL